MQCEIDSDNHVDPVACTPHRHKRFTMGPKRPVRDHVPTLVFVPPFVWRPQPPVYYCIFPTLLARNLHREASSGTEDDYSSDTPAPPATPPPEAEAGSRTTILSHMAMDMFLSRGAAAAGADDAAATSSSSSYVQGLTQMYYLELEEEERALASTTAEPLPVRQPQHAAVGAEAVFAASDVAAEAESMIPTAEPQGLTQVFFLDPEDEALAAAALPVVPGRSFLRERLGVPGEVVQDLRQVSGQAGSSCRKRVCSGRREWRAVPGRWPKVV